MQALPLKEDFDEAGAVYGMLCSLASSLTTNAQMAHLLPSLVQVRPLLWKSEHGRSCCADVELKLQE